MHLRLFLCAAIFRYADSNHNGALDANEPIHLVNGANSGVQGIRLTGGPFGSQIRPADVDYGVAQTGISARACRSNGGAAVGDEQHVLHFGATNAAAAGDVRLAATMVNGLVQTPGSVLTAADAGAALDHCLNVADALKHDDIDQNALYSQGDTTVVDFEALAVTPQMPLLKVHYVNVGQEDGTIWELPDGSLIVYDCGDARPNNTSNPMNQYLLNTLGKRVGSRLHALIASHGHEDHVAGCEEVLADYDFDYVYEAWYQGPSPPGSYTAFRNQILTEGTHGAQLHFLVDDPAVTGEQVFHQWDLIPVPTPNVNIQIVWPPSFQGTIWGDLAESSIVLRLTYGSVDYCFQGDVETSQENVIGNYVQDPNCEVYLIGHHGSNAASSVPWLQKTDPEFAPVSFGTNGYQHPRPEALCRAQQAGAGTNTLTDLYWGRSQGVWNNSGDTASLKDAAMNLVDVESY